MQKCSEKFAAPLQVSNEHRGVVLQERIVREGTGKATWHRNPRESAQFWARAFEESRSPGVEDWEQSYGWRLEPDETGPHKKGDSQTGA